MSRRVTDKLGKLLIITSFILFAIAAYMSNIVNHQYDSEGRLVAGSGNLFITVRPEDELTAEDINDNGATGGEKTPDNTGEVDNPNAGDNNNNPSNNESNGGNNGNNGNNGNGGDIGGGSTPVNPSTPNPPAPPEPPAIDPAVVNLRNTIQSRYGLPIRLSVEVNGYSVGGYSTAPVTDTGELLNALYSLDNDLSKYPSGLFYELTSSKPLNIYLVKNYSNNSITGVTDHSGSTTIISVATDKDFDVTLHHEMFHYMERYVTGRGANFSSWNNFNPVGFYYVGNDTAAINDSLSYTKNGGRADSYFVNRYAQTSAAEDRASTFEYMMADNKAACLNNGMPVYQKARFMADQLDYFTNSCSSGTTEYWERFL